MKDCILVTNTDFERLRRLVDGRSGGSSPDVDLLEMLEQELDRAEIVAPHEMPHDVVTMNSEVRLQDLDSGVVKLYKLVFPSRFQQDNNVSILAPIGTAMLGYRTGDVIEWRVPQGIRRLKILAVLYQPEAAEARR